MKQSSSMVLVNYLRFLAGAYCTVINNQIICLCWANLMYKEIPVIIVFVLVNAGATTLF